MEVTNYLLTGMTLQAPASNRPVFGALNLQKTNAAQVDRVQDEPLPLTSYNLYPP